MLLRAAGVSLHRHSGHTHCDRPACLAPILSRVKLTTILSRLMSVCVANVIFVVCFDCTDVTIVFTAQAVLPRYGIAEFAGLENDGRSRRGGICRTGK